METSFERVSMIILVGRDDWELFAEKLGLTPAEISFFGQAHKEPSVGSFNFRFKKISYNCGRSL